MTGATPQTRRLATLLTALFLLGLAPTATAHGGDEHGTLTLHDAPDGPDARTVSCEFWVRGTGMSHSSGTLRVAHDLDGPGAHSHHLADWTGTPDGDGTYSFEVGPLTIHESDEDTNVGAFLDGIEHHTAAYWVEYESCDEAPEEGDSDDGGLDLDLCAVALVATAQGDGSVRVHAGGLAESAVLQRAGGGGTFEQVAVLGPQEHIFVDAEAEAGVTYTYRVLVDSEVCASVQVTSIPVFPTPLAGVLAAGVAVVGYVGLRRRS